MKKKGLREFDNKFLLVRLPIEVHRELKLIAVEEGITLASIAEMAFEDVLRKLRERKGK